MKKLLSLLLALCMILSFIPAVSAEPVPIAGDVSGDGKVTPYDALQVQAYLHGQLTLTDEQIARAVAACDSIPTLSTAHVVAIFFQPLVGKSAQAPEADGMYHIRSDSDMALLRSFPYAGFSLDADINMAGVSWAPPVFHGTLLGNGHTISNLTVSASTNNTNASALFLKLGSESNKAARVSDLHLASATLTTTATHRSAGLVTGTNYGTVENISITNGTITGAINASENAVGAAVGVNYGSVSVSGVPDYTIAYTANSEGVIGRNDGIGSAGHTGGELAMQYDDHLTLAGLGYGTPQITAQSVTSNKVGTNTPDDAVVIAQDGELIAVGTGTATVTFDDATYDVTVSAAPISMFMVVGHSVGAGYLASGTGSVYCAPGTAYSTHEAYDTSNPVVHVISDMDVTGYGLGSGSENRLPKIDAFSTTGVRAGDAAIAWRWRQLTGEKAWVLSAAHSGSKLDTWQPGTVDYEHAYDLYGKAKQVMNAEQAAGHYVLSHSAVFYHCTANGDQHYDYDKYYQMFTAMWGGLKNAYGIEAIGLIPFTHTTYVSGVATLGRQANFYMASSAAHPDVFLASDDAVNFIQDSTIPAYAAAHPILYTAHGGALAVPKTVTDLLYDKCHFKAVGSNYVGIEIAENTNLYFTGGVEAQGARFKDMSTKLMLDDNLTQLRMEPSSTLALAIYAEPNGVSDLTYETEGDLTWTYPGVLTTGAGFTGGKLIVKQGSKTVRTLQILSPEEAAFDLVHVVTGETTVNNDLSVLEGTAVQNQDGSVDFSSAVAKMKNTVDFRMDQDWTISFTYARDSTTGERYVFGTDTQIKGLGAGRMFLSIKSSGELQLSDLSTEYRYYMTETENLPTGFDPTARHLYTVTNRGGVVSYSIDGQPIGAFTHYNVTTTSRTNYLLGSFSEDFTLNYVGVKAYSGTAAKPFTLKDVEFSVAPAVSYDLVHVLDDASSVNNDLTVQEGTAVQNQDGSVSFTQAVAKLSSTVSFRMVQDWTIRFTYARGSATGTRYVFGTDTQIKGLGAGRMFLSIKDTGELQLSDLSTEYRYYMTAAENLPTGFDPTAAHIYEVTNRGGVVSYSIDGQPIGAFTHYNVSTNSRNNYLLGSFNEDFTIDYVGAKAYGGAASNPFTLKSVEFVPAETTAPQNSYQTQDILADLQPAPEEQTEMQITSEPAPQQPQAPADETSAAVS